MQHWRISPGKSCDADFFVMPAEDNDDNIAALEYAQEVLEMLWDQIQDDCPVSVTIELCSETNDWIRQLLEGET